MGLHSCRSRESARCESVLLFAFPIFKVFSYMDVQEVNGARGGHFLTFWDSPRIQSFFLRFESESDPQQHSTPQQYIPWRQQQRQHFFTKMIETNGKQWKDSNFHISKSGETSKSIAKLHGERRTSDSLSDSNQHRQIRTGSDLGSNLPSPTQGILTWLLGCCFLSAISGGQLLYCMTYRYLLLQLMTRCAHHYHRLQN